MKNIPMAPEAELNLELQDNEWKFGYVDHGRSVANRELPVLNMAKEFMEKL